MQFPQQVVTATQRWLLALMLLTAAPALAAPAAEAAGPRPLFQMPFACGQTWEASTYDGHWPDQDSIDLGEWDHGRRQHEPGRAGARHGRRQPCSTSSRTTTAAIASTSTTATAGSRTTSTSSSCRR